MNPLKKLLIDLGLIPDPKPPKASPNHRQFTVSIGDQIYIVRYHRDQTKRVPMAFTLWASNPELEFNWKDAGIVCTIFDMERSK